MENKINRFVILFSFFEKEGGVWFVLFFVFYFGFFFSGFFKTGVCVRVRASMRACLALASLELAL